MALILLKVKQYTRKDFIKLTTAAGFRPVYFCKT